MLAALAVFVGSQACQPCHPAIAKSYAQTPMARSSGSIDTITLPPAEFTANGHRFRIADNRLSFVVNGRDHEVAMDYFIGSAAAGRSFLFSRDRYLFEIPVTWYSRKAIWDASPGYERNKDMQLNRAVEPSCLFCHTSRVQPIFGTQNRYAEKPFLEDGISCERCHGPGSEHVNDPQSPMVNPAKLKPVLRDSVCNQCHLTGEARIERAGRRMAEFRAGEDLADYATYFVRSRNLTDMKVTSHVEKLAGSACKQTSGDKLWCGTCHDVHASDQTRVTSEKTQAACVGCHTASHKNNARREENCAGCHMPKSAVVDGGHGVLTDHGISTKQSHRTGDKELVAFVGVADDRAKGLAYGELGDARARGILRRARPVDSAVQLQLAAMEDDPHKARALYEAVLRSNPGHTVALVNLGSLYAQMGHPEAAARLWRRALEANPGLEEAVLNLAQVSEPATARTILTDYLGWNPSSKAVRERLRSILQK